MEKGDYEKKTEGFTAIVVHPYLNPMARSVFKVPNEAGPWEATCREVIVSGAPLRIEAEGQVLLVPLGRDVFVSIMPWEEFQRRVEREQMAARLNPNTIVRPGGH